MFPRILLLLVLICVSCATPKEVVHEGPLFELVPSDQTNILFNNTIEDTKEHNVLIYSNYYGGAGVGIGDINNDGLQDIYFAGNLVPDKLYLNKGNFEFEEITKQAGITDRGEWSSGVIIGDVNSDGHLDIYVTCELYDDGPELRKNKLFINNGDLTFSEKSENWGVADTARTRHATFIDYDLDGDLDLFLLNQPPNPGDYSKYYDTELLLEKHTPRLLANHGDHFIDVTEQAGLLKPGFPNSVSAADLNNDGWPDLFVANDFWVGDWCYMNNGDGTFTDKIHEQFRHTSFSSMGVDAADINNDGLTDIMVVDMVAEDNYRMKANMSGMNPRAFQKVVDDGGGYQYMFNMLHLNQQFGFGDVAQMAGVASTDWSWSNLIADFNNDGLKDIHVTNGLMRDIRNNDATTRFSGLIETTIAEFLKNNPNPENISIWDLVDINDALAEVPSQKLSNYYFSNQGDLSFSNVTAESGLDQVSFSNGSAYADLDNDGDLDLVVNNINDKAFVYQNNASSSGNHYLRIRPIADRPGVSAMGVKATIESSSGKQYSELVSVRGMYSTSESVLHFGLGQEDRVQQVHITWPDGRENVLRDVSADQMLEVRASKSSAGPSKSQPIEPLLDVAKRLGIDFTHREDDFDDFFHQVLLPHKMSTSGPALAKGDINGDGLDDLFVGGANKQSGALFRQTTSGDFEKVVVSDLDQDAIHEDVAAVFFDADSDGDQDLYVVSGGNEFPAEAKYYWDRLYLNDGSGDFLKSSGHLPDLRNAGAQVRPCDFDQDGDLDLLIVNRHIPWAYPEPASSTLLQNDGGIFSDVSAKLAPALTDIGMLNDGLWIDYNSDGKQDLLLAGEWTPLIILQQTNDGFERIVDQVLDEQVGWWFSLEKADFDGDGDQDFVAGNLGLNYKYKASPEEPFEVYYDDFDANGSKDIVLAYYNFGELYPLRGRECSSQQVPQIKESFETYDIFASSDLKGVYGSEQLSSSLHYAATTFASVYAENRDGKFALRELPRAAQVSSINDILVEDVDRDGSPDLILAGNLYSAEVETARNDAGHGLILQNDGTGDFKAISPRQSGLYLPSQVQVMSKITVENFDYWVFSTNNSALAVFGRGSTPISRIDP